MSNEFPDQIWKVCKGRCMGLLHAGDVADLAYYNGAERVWAACSVIMEAYGIMNIWRFRDDILVLASERFKTHAYGRGMINRAGYFITQCEKVSYDKIKYLDCEVWVENGTIQSKPFVKPTNLGVPLQDTSCHPAHTHKSWPVSMVRRLGDLSTSHIYAEKAKNILIEWFVKHMASPNLINRLRATSYEDIDDRGTSKWRQDVGHFPIPSGFVCTCCKSSQTILERRKLERHSTWGAISVKGRADESSTVVLTVLSLCSGELNEAQTMGNEPTCVCLSCLNVGVTRV